MNDIVDWCKLLGGCEGGAIVILKCVFEVEGGLLLCLNSKLLVVVVRFVFFSTSMLFTITF